ncbi:tetratricopeptide repeat protein [Flavobacterium sp. K5-23]|uniref:tetratricopeptide repeat protein n=1 Tax=Flavobacterium sp. K5-23 TaxID=2746225 RepID=UPI00200DF30C|nr:tetratricopeptide repeat protein [Flavobacterium sp. K5-23]UQD54959.1 tetratricopeptide repeat protein [Flavobacterium sp. K5-23]
MKINILLPLVLIIIASCSNPIQDRKNANRFFKDKNYENALFEINKVIYAEPDSVSHYAFRVMIYDAMGKYKEEMFDLNTIIDLDKKKNIKSLTAYHQRSIVQTQLGLYRNALSDINYFIANRDTVGSLAEAYTNKASILYKLGDYKNSQKYYELSVKNITKKEIVIESQALVGLANLSKSAKGALILLDKAISIDAKNPIAYGARAAINIDLGKIKEGYADSKKAISLNPNDPMINFNMGQLFINIINNADSAVFYFEKAIKLSPQSPKNDVIYMNLAVLKHRSGKLESALSDFQKAEIINPKNDLLLYNLAMLLSDMGKQEAALDKISKAIKLNSKDAEYFNLKGSILIELSLYEDATKEFLTAIKLNPNYGGAFYNLGYLYGEQDNHNQSIKYYSKAVMLKFDLKATLVNLALQKIKINKSPCDDLKTAYNLGREDIKPLINKYCN